MSFPEHGDILEITILFLRVLVIWHEA